MKKDVSRRDFLKTSAIGAGAIGVAAMGLASCSTTGSTGTVANGGYRPGTYSATALGMAPVTVTMTFNSTKITDVKIDGSHESSNVGRKVVDAVNFKQQILDRQSADVDVISGATVTCDAIHEAAAACIAQAKGEAVVVAAAIPENLPNGIKKAELEASTCEVGTISNASNGGSYDVVVIGAGTSGIPCALRAADGGLKVLLLQKDATAIAQGGGGSGIILNESDNTAIMHFINQTSLLNDRRSSWAKLKNYAFTSGEALAWHQGKSSAAGYEPVVSRTVVDYGEDGKVTRLAVNSHPKPHNIRNQFMAIADANANVIDIRYNTPAVQLVKEGGAVTGVIAKDKAGKYYRFSARKGVVIATGDYQNNPAMVARYCPDVMYFEPKQYHKTGDGHLMGMAAGGHLELLGHTKMIHDFDSGPMFDEPFLRIDASGKRFQNEKDDMSYANNYLRHQKKEAGHYYQIFDDNFEEQVRGWGGRAATHESIKVYMPEERVERKGVVQTLIDTYKADTLDELAKKIGLPADALKNAVARYNELCDKGYDDEFGKPAKYLKKIEKAPFWAINKNIRISALCSGLVTSDNYEVLDENENVIKGLYAIGNCGGGFYGAPDYPLHWPGMSIGRCITEGYIVGKALAGK